MRCADSRFSRRLDIPGKSTSILDLWGKLAPARRGQYHPLLYHLIDSACMAQALWQEVLPPATQDLYCDLMVAEPAQARRWLAFLVGLHDLGKATPGFQGQAAAQRRRLREAGWTMPEGALRAHDVMGLMILRGVLRDEAEGAIAADATLALATAVAGHHGIPPTPRPGADAERHMGDGAWGAARVALLGRLMVQAEVLDDPMPVGLVRPTAPLLSLLGGLVRVSDWLASKHCGNDALPASQTTELGEEEYTSRTREVCDAAVLGCDWGKLPPSLADFEALFGFPANSTQECIARLAGPVRGPAMVLIEAPTGVGKTEAALHLVNRWHANGLPGGAYLALPTQATATAMHRRLERTPGYAGGRLCHAAAVTDDAPLPGDAARLLERLGVGTIDQALLAVVSDRQAWVRLLGLAHKIVVLDEVHAYDAYTSGLLKRLLGWLAALRCPVILLSATLPRALQAELLEAYTGHHVAVELAYPRLTLATSTYQETASLPMGEGETVQLRHLKPETDLGAELAGALCDGGCAAVICNSVQSAQDTYRQLRATLPAQDVTVELLHARFPRAEREARERTVVEWFGKNGQRAKRTVLVATQVVEQSLDLDFDLLVSELAPMDVLLQRRGRLHRHSRTRPERLQAPQLWLIQPPCGGDGLPDFGAAACIYDEYVLLRAWEALRGRSALHLPHETEELIEACYRGLDDDHGDDAPLSRRLAHAWERLRIRKETQEYAALQHSTTPCGLPPMGLSAATHACDLPTATVVCLQRQSGALRIAGTDVTVHDPLTRAQVDALVAHAIPLRGHELASHVLGAPQPSSWQHHGELRHLTPLYLDDALTARVGRSTVCLSETLGLVVSA